MGRTFIGIRTVIGGLAGGGVLYLVGFLFWGTPLSTLAFSKVDDAANAQLQAALAQGLTQSGTGTYHIPWPSSPQGTVLHGRGPIATIHFNTQGFAPVDSASLLTGLVLALITGVLIALGLTFAGVRTFGERVRIVVLLSLAATLYLDIGQPVFNHYGAGYFIYTFVADVLGLSAAGIVIARWFMSGADAGVTRH
ncbi:hypothetical protein [Sphingomonas solaris]|uniref:Uncharacterized protein n=1 Tax=Alterirhizorhabdus solaris TaxID=2529389 RepID=A0A558QW18_9SPHN|nr:hypothetical protein [Sphingomonas solaris]TVV71356.1 hypothetical protein FOY91_17005 [Sphingomonas solaris]